MSEHKTNKRNKLKQQLESNDEMRAKKNVSELGNEFAEEFSEGPYGAEETRLLEDDQSN